jgi:hypothetical protein
MKEPAQTGYDLAVKLKPFIFRGMTGDTPVYGEIWLSSPMFDFVILIFSRNQLKELSNTEKYTTRTKQTPKTQTLSFEITLSL